MAAALKLQDIKSRSHLVPDPFAAENRGAAKFDQTDSAKDKIEYVYRLLAHDKLIQPLAKAQLDLPHMKHKLAMWISKQLPEGHALLK